MNAHQLRYLHVLHRHAAGPLQSLAGDASGAHLLKAMAGILARLVSGGSTQASRADRLREAARTVMQHLPEALHEVSDVRQLSAAIEVPGDDASGLETLLAQTIRLLAAHPGPQRERILQTLVMADHDCWNEIEIAKAELLGQAPMQMEAAAGTALLGKEQELAQWLRAACGESSALRVSGLKLVPGGFSKQTLFAQLQEAEHLGTELVLRVDRPESPLQTTVIAEYPLLQILHAAGVRVPRPLAVDPGHLIGAPLMAVERLPGRVVADGQHFTEKDLPFSLAISLAGEMAKYHRIAVSDLPAGLPGSGMSVAQIMAAELGKFREIWRQTGYQSIAVEAAFIWLAEHLDQAGEKRALVHGDMRFHNVLVDADEVTALLDWEIASIGHPALDLGYVYRHIVQLGSWRAFLDAYGAAGGEVPAAATLDFYAVRTELFTVVYLSRMAAAFQAGAFERLDLGYAAIELRQHAVLLLAERLRAVMAGEGL